jgi:hypothetical protein
MREKEHPKRQADLALPLGPAPPPPPHPRPPAPPPSLALWKNPNCSCPLRCERGKRGIGARSNTVLITKRRVWSECPWRQQHRLLHRLRESVRFWQNRRLLRLPSLAWQPVGPLNVVGVSELQTVIDPRAWHFKREQGLPSVHALPHADVPLGCQGDRSSVHTSCVQSFTQQGCCQ